MTQKLNLILISIATIYLLQPANAANADITVCGWTNMPDACWKCFETDPRSPGMDEKGLAFLSITCAWELALPVIGEFTGIANSTGDKAVKDVCTRCEQILADSISNSDKAMTDFKNGDYKAAADDMANAGDAYSACYGLVQNIPSPPVKFLDDSSTLKKYFRNAEAILYNLGEVEVLGKVA